MAEIEQENSKQRAVIRMKGRIQKAGIERKRTNDRN